MTAKKNVQRLGATVLAAVAWSFSATSSAVPNLLTQQGRLFDRETGEPLTGSVTLVFTLYDDPEASEEENVLWKETQAVTLDDGYFSAVLGEEEDLDPALFDGSVRYLGVKVGADDEMTPRQAVTSMPYAMRAGVAEKVAWSAISGFPAVCGSGQFLKGFNASGVPQCGAPALSCQRRSAGMLGGVTEMQVACSEGEILTGGGCFAGVSPVMNAPSDGEWVCVTTTTTGITAHAICCRVQ